MNDKKEEKKHTFVIVARPISGRVNKLSQSRRLCGIQVSSKSYFVF